MYKFEPRKVMVARLDAGLTQAQVADMIGVSRQAYCSKESGKVAFNTTELTKLSKITSSPVELFFTVI